MKSRNWLIIVFTILLTGIIIFAGCGKTTTTTPQSPSPTVQPGTTTTQAATTTTAKPGPTTSVVPSPTATTPTPQYGGTLIIGEYADPLLYPPKMRAPTDYRMAAPVLEALLRCDKTGKPSPWLATGFTNDSTAKTITLTLRKDVKFHDGTDFNAEAVKWNLEKFMAVKASGSANLASVDVIDNYTVRINLKVWDSTVPDGLSGTIGTMMSPTAYKTNGEEWCVTHPVGTGPFKFVSWEREARIVYEKFDGYWQKGKPYLDRIQIDIIKDAVTREMNFRAKKDDVTMEMPAKVLTAMQQEGNFNIALFNSGGWYFAPDSANPNSPFANVKVRQALAYAIDKNAISKGLYGGFFKPSNQYVYQGHWGYNPSVIGYPYDTTKAKQLLSDAGYSKGLNTTIHCSGADANQTGIATAVQGYLKDLGIDVKIDGMEQGAVFTMMSGGWKDIFEANAWSGADPLPQMVSMINRENFPSIFMPDDFVTTTKEAAAASDFATKQKKFQELMALAYDKYCLMIPTVTRSFSTVLYPYVHDHGFMGTADMGNWTPADTWLEKH